MPKKSMVNFYVPAYVPGNIEYIFNMDVQNVIFCLEDGTPENKKHEARYLLRKALTYFKDKKKYITVRINSYFTDHWKDDLNHILSCEINSIRIPMVNSAKELIAIENYIKEKTGGSDIPSLEVMVESVEGLKNLEEIVKSSNKITALTVGGEDLANSLIEQSKTIDINKELYNSKSKICKIAKEYNLHSLDTTYMDYLDEEGFVEDCIKSKQLGFSGRSIMHPNQVAIANRIYN